MRCAPILLLAALAFAGCASTSLSTKGPVASSDAGFGVTVQQAVAEHPALSGWTLDCQQGLYSRVEDDAWGQACVARGSHTPGPKEEMWAAVNPKDPANAVVGAKDLDPAASPGCVWNGLAVTHDAGKTWKDVHIGGSFASRQPGSPFFGYYCNTDPDFRFDLAGDLHYSIEMYGLCPLPPSEGPNAACAANAHGETVGWKILLATSHDGGDTFPDVVTYQPDLAITTDYSRMQVSPTTGTAIEAIGSEGGVGCNVLRWTKANPGTPTFMPVVTKDGIPCNSGGGSGVAISPTGTVVLIGAAGVVARSNDDGLTFLDSNPLFTFNGIHGPSPGGDYRITNNVEAAYDWFGAHKGTLYATYAASERKGDDADIYVRSSTDDGKTWTDPVLVNTDPAGTFQWMPGVAVAADGSVHIAYMDKAYDTAKGHTLIDITHAVSVDGGKTWQSERVTTKSFDGNLGVHQDGGPFIGDYLGIDCVGTDCWMGFPDSHEGNVPVIAAAHTHQA
jgi:hypothetical protein